MYQSSNSDVNDLLKKLETFNTYSRIGNLLRWDAETLLPKKGSALRTKEISAIDVLSHQSFIALNKNNLLNNLYQQKESLPLDDQIIVSDLKREYDLKNTLPESLVVKLSECSSEGTILWQQARKQNNKEVFMGKLSEMINLKKEVISLRESDLPYDVLLDEFEPGLTTDVIEPILEEVKQSSIELIKKLRAKSRLGKEKLNHKHIDINKQKEFNDELSKLVGFKFSKGVTGISTHPFTSEQSPNDVRFTSRYKETDILYAISSTMHETGHGLYEQNLPYDKYGTPLAKYVSLGIHESQSRFYENQIGRNFEFSKLISLLAEKILGLNLPAKTLFDHMNSIEPGLIRVEADELTYNLHIVIRFEIEKAIFNDDLPVQDIENLWNEKYEKYLGIRPGIVSGGFLQDVHWSQGLMGYFPTYTLGNIYAAQITDAMTKELGNLDELISNKEFERILDWLTVNIYQHGRKMNALELVERVTGDKLNTRPLINRLTEKTKAVLDH